MTLSPSEDMQDGADAHDQTGKGSLVAIGLGGAQRIAAHLQMMAEALSHMLIVDPEAEPWLQNDADKRKTAQFVLTAAALDDRDGTADLTFFTVPWLRSFQAPTDRLRDLFPNLRAKATRPVPTISAKTLADQIAGFPQPLALWIEAAGSEMRLLTLLDRAGLLHRFSTLTVQCCAGSFFEGAAPRDAVQGWLEQRGFCVTAGDLDDADWPRLNFRLEKQGPVSASAMDTPLPDGQNCAPTPDGPDHFAQLQAENLSLAARLAEQEKQIAMSAQDRTNLIAQLADLKSDAAARIKRINDLTAALLVKSDQLRAQSASCAEVQHDLSTAGAKVTSLEARVADLAQQLVSTKARQGVLESQLAGAQSQIAAQVEQINRLSAVANESLRSLDAVQAEASHSEHALNTALLEAQAEIAVLQQTENNQRDRIASLEQTSASASNDLSVALRLQAMHTADLGDLRDRYAKNLAEKDRQDALLQNLMARLAKAAEYLAEMDRLPASAAAPMIVSETSRSENLPATLPSQAKLKADKKAKRKADKKAKRLDQRGDRRGRK